MWETLFSFDRGNFRDGQANYRGRQGLEYYLGDFWIEDCDRIDVRSERKTLGPISIIMQRSATNLFFRRTRQHIRVDGTDLSILWFVKQGRMTFSERFGSTTLERGDFAITRSTQPLFVECKVDAASEHEVLHVTLPTHVLRAHVPCEDSINFLMPAKRPELLIAENIVTDLFEDGGDLGGDSAHTLVKAALKLIGLAVRLDGSPPARSTVPEQRQRDIVRFIEINLSNPHLSAKMVAAGCGISPRYLSALLHMNGTSFTTLVWRRRLERARSSLAISELQDVTISEIAYGLGFKSSAHFSRLFKRVFGVNPSTFRLAANEALQSGAPARRDRLRSALE